MIYEPRVHLKLSKRPWGRYVPHPSVRDRYTIAACGDIWGRAKVAKHSSEVTCGACWNTVAMRELAQAEASPRSGTE